MATKRTGQELEFVSSDVLLQGCMDRHGNLVTVLDTSTHLGGNTPVAQLRKIILGPQGL